MDFEFENITVPRIQKGNVKQNPTLKRFLIKTYGHKCMGACNLTDWCGNPIPLDLDHIDGNSDNCLPNNIRLLCPNCHTTTETYCGRNKKNTKRNTYMQRYRLRKISGTG